MTLTDPPHVFYVIDGSSLEVFDADNQPIGTFDYKDGDVLPLRLEGDVLFIVGDESLSVPATHSARNAGNTPYREILVETKPDRK